MEDDEDNENYEDKIIGKGNQSGRRNMLVWRKIYMMSKRFKVRV